MNHLQPLRDYIMQVIRKYNSIYSYEFFMDLNINNSLNKSITKKVTLAQSVKSFINTSQTCTPYFQLLQNIFREVSHCPVLVLLHSEKPSKSGLPY